MEARKYEGEQYVVIIMRNEICRIKDSVCDSCTRLINQMDSPDLGLRHYILQVIHHPIIQYIHLRFISTSTSRANECETSPSASSLINAQS